MKRYTPRYWQIIMSIGAIASVKVAWAWEGGTYVMVRSAKDLSDYTSRRAALMEALASLRKKFGELLREFDHYNGSMRPDLSYTAASEKSE